MLFNGDQWWLISIKNNIRKNKNVSQQWSILVRIILLLNRIDMLFNGDEWWLILVKIISDGINMVFNSSKNENGNQ